MNRFITAAVAACALFTATAASAEYNLLDRQIVAPDGTALGTLYIIVNTDEGAKDDVFTVMYGDESFPPASDFVLLPPNSIVIGAEDGAWAMPLRQINNWKVRQDPTLHKAVDHDGDCSSIYQKLFYVTGVDVADETYVADDDEVAVMGERSACANEGKLMWFRDSAFNPSNTRALPQTSDGAEALYFASIDSFGPAAAAHTWYSRGWMPAQ